MSGPTVFKYFLPLPETSLVHHFFVLLRDLLSDGDDRPFSVPPLSRLPSSPSLPFPSLRLSPFLQPCSTAGFFLRLEVFWTDFHLHPFEGVAGPMPAVPGDAIQVLVVLSEAVVNSIEVGVCAAVVPVPT